MQTECVSTHITLQMCVILPLSNGPWNTCHWTAYIVDTTANIHTGTTDITTTGHKLKWCNVTLIYSRHTISTDTNWNAHRSLHHIFQNPMQGCTSLSQAISDLKEMCYRMITEEYCLRVKVTKNDVHNSPVFSAMVTNAYRNTRYILMATAHNLVDRHG